MKPEHPVAGNDQQGEPGSRFRTVAGVTILFDQEGFLWDASDWNEDVAGALARESGIASLGEEHWKVIKFFREFYRNNGRAPLNRQLAKGTTMSLLTIENLFPGGIKHGARRIAGLPNPKACL